MFPSASPQLGQNLLVLSQVQFIENLSRTSGQQKANVSLNPVQSTASFLSQGALASPMINQLESQMNTAESAIDGINRIASELDRSLELAHLLNQNGSDPVESKERLQQLDDIKESFHAMDKTFKELDKQMGENYIENKIHHLVKDSVSQAKQMMDGLDFESSSIQTIHDTINKAKLHILGNSAKVQDTLQTLSKSVIQVSKVQYTYQSAQAARNFANAFSTSDLYSLSTRQATASFQVDQETKFIGKALDFVS